jgi:NADH dehydrogenase FAD-containing subunit
VGVENVHVIGDACIADPMPKSASAAVAHAKQCALAIIAAFEGLDAPSPQFESVCYGMLARGMALSIHGRFRPAGGMMQQMPWPEDTGSVRPEQEAQNADDWYRNIVADAFGT